MSRVFNPRMINLADERMHRRRVGLQPDGRNLIVNIIRNPSECIIVKDLVRLRDTLLVYRVSCNTLEIHYHISSHWMVHANKNCESFPYVRTDLGTLSSMFNKNLYNPLKHPEQEMAYI